MSHTSKGFVRGLAFVLMLSAVAPLVAQPAPAGEILLALRKLDEMGSVLMIGAHPDDERTEVLAYFARARSMRAAYLSVTRGDGGQNLLGAEQGPALGLIRTQELLAARRIDGAEQYFTRAIDFGFSKTADETLQKWDHGEVLSDVVWVIRRYRPDVIVLCFSGTPSDGHGHHQASAILGKEAFDAAGDPSRFPEQLKYVQPWKPAKIVTSGFGGRGGTTPAVAPSAQINTAGYNAIMGYTYQQLATISRSQHRSQGLGAMGIGGGLGGGRGGAGGGPPAGPGAAPAGPGGVGAPAAGQPAAAAAPGGGRGGRGAGAGGRGGAAPAAAGGDAPPADLFDGIEHSWKRVPGGAAVEAILLRAVRDFDWDHPEKTIPLLAQARPLIAAIDDPLAKIKLADLDETIARSAGIWADAAARQPSAAPGSRVAVAVTVSPRIPVEMHVRSLRAEGLWAGPAWTPAAGATGAAIPDYDLAVPATQPYSQPYWLVKPPTCGHVHHWRPNAGWPPRVAGGAIADGT